MKKTSQFLFITLVVGFLVSCNSTRRTIYKSSKKENSLSKEQILFTQSDQIFDDFKSGNRDRLNTYTLEYIDRYKHIAIEDMV
ncbi:MAG: hypothetical protein KAT78_05145, partial [Flavobacteriaceae bacterium]|nr:hypothetical protein [Flavobacteriaceae bacterium]